MQIIRIQNLKQRYEDLFQIYKTLDKEQKKIFTSRFQECKELKNKALNCVTLSSKNFLLSQCSKKLQTLEIDINEVKKQDDHSKYKLEAQRLEKIFVSQKLSNEEKLYLTNKAAQNNGFNSDEFISYMKNEFKLLAKSVAYDVDRILTLGI